MAKPKIRGGQDQKSLDKDMRSRINALLGDFKPTREMVDASIAPLLERLKKEQEASQARENEFLKAWRTIAKAGPKARRPSSGPRDGSGKSRSSGI